MNGSEALLDSNIIIYLSKRELSVYFLDRFKSVFISVITYMEVLGYNFTDSREMDFVNELISIFDVRFIDQKIADVVIDIRKKYQIKLPDAIIAGTALVDGLCLVTRNIEDFKNTDCTILNPFDEP
jgi:toxin FitB